MDEGEFWYYGVKEILKMIHKEINLRNFPNLTFKIHVDGLDIFKSSKVSLWPILCELIELPQLKPQPIAIYCGTSKPTNASQYFERFVNEMVDLFRCS